MDISEKIKSALTASIELKQAILGSTEQRAGIEEVVEILVSCLQNDGKVLFCGNGGSAADAQHLAAELSGRFYYDRPPLYAEALHVNTSYLTAVANDYGYEAVYERMINASGREGDVLIALSTSGRSPNILRALKAARENKMHCIGFSGKSGGEMASYCDLLLRVPSSDTPRIQEAHMLIGHIICELVEATLFPEKKS